MKSSIWVILALFANVAALGGIFDAGGSLDKYSPAGDVYYKGIAESEGGGGRILSSKTRPSTSWIMNLQVFDLSSGKSWKVFEKDLGSNYTISELVFEGDRKSGSSSAGGRRFQNIPPNRNAKEQILIVVRNIKDRSEELWVANAHGKGLRKVVAISAEQNWHIDLLNEKIRVFSRLKTEFRMDEYVW